MTLLQQFISWVQALGPAGYLAFIVGYALCCVFLIPASALTLAAGAVFGFGPGSAVVLIGATLGAAAAFLLGRTVLRHRVEGFVAARPKLQAVDRAIAAEGVRLMLLMRLSGFPPFTWINYALSLSGVRFVPYVLTTFFGIIPGVLAFTWAGAAGAKALTGEGNRIALVVTAIGGVLVSVYIARIAARAVRRAQ
jgi:uncharacterized membrane protein YdjX (TVP38/TMEM64 family)